MEGDVTENEIESWNAEESLHTNPMLIEVIQNQIIEYLPFQNLKTCRLISKLWNETVSRSKRFKSKSTNFVVFGYNQKYDVGNPSCPLGDMVRLVDCLRSPLTIDNFPLHTFIVVTSGFLPDLNLKESTLRDFLNAVSPLAEKILIHHDREFASPDQIETANWSDFPRLKYLKLDLLEPELGIISIFLGHLMRQVNSPELEKLYIRWKWTRKKMPDASVSKLLSQLNVPRTTSKLTSLKIKLPLKPQHLKELKNLELNLREFHIEVKNTSDSGAASTLRSILQKQSKTLTRLKFIDWQEYYKPTLRQVQIFPKTMINLESLIIHTENIIFQDILLKERFPGLKSLTFTGETSPWNEFFGRQLEPTLSINELLVTRRFRYEAILLKAVKYFPNIRKLQVPAVSKMTNIVFDKMSQLEELALDTTYFRCIDHIITGMTLEECEDVLGRMTDWRQNIEVLASIRDVRLTNKPISCLTKLKTLRLLSIDNMNTYLETEFRKKKAEISKLSYLMVLLNMDSLRCIDFGERRFSPNYQLQPSVWRRVSSKFQILCTTKTPFVRVSPERSQ